MEALRSWMADNGLNDQELADQIGVSRVQVLRIRTGQNRPSPETATKLEAITGIPAASFIFGERAA